MQPIRVTYNQACELLSIKRDALRLLVQQDTTFPRPIKYGSNRQSPVYFDYADLLAWHNLQEIKNLNTQSPLSELIRIICKIYAYSAKQEAYEELNLLHLQAKIQKAIGSFHGKGLNQHKSTMKYLNQKISKYEEDLQLKLWENIRE
ncbi:Prophage antirepressor [Acinetobacter haemolyticus]|uniref:Uncharacterized protein n=1 Tax=Acinetobacter haemolyticus CIP 64.3 = MTCC 9819 TaxID=1217659 RepID=N9GFP6_ACIHA|nr:hypothetical protein [Acinetobacter haemolyticus]ENW18325.1 hypothetical protein F927_01769 [Acinetobacter haemolyticus CIP 64.3 = MTCC 9819]QXZ25434.1 hypothetical protein I6L22_09285 [Acinetobacter haemolyticus]SPT47889.1 Prophage antirepressor [Acinetobacter haemolyticus]SUU56922.1 Prophage antirepressor [Acinetobacter haemolyticus]